MVLEWYFGRPQWFNPLIALLVFALSLLFAYWLTRLFYNKRHKWSVFAPLLSLAMVVVLTAHMWGPIIWLFFGLYAPDPEWLVVIVLYFLPVMLVLFSFVFLVQFVFTKQVYKKLKQKHQAPFQG